MKLKDIFDSAVNENAEVTKGVVAGILGGIAGAIAIQLFESFVPEEEKVPTLSPAVKATNSMLALANQGPLNAEDQKLFAEIGKYPFGFIVGGAYGALVEKFPIAKDNNGLGLSALVYTAVNQNIAPPMNVLNTITKNPLKEENRELFTLALFGITTEFVRRGVRKFLG